MMLIIKPKDNTELILFNGNILIKLKRPVKLLLMN